MAFTPLCFLLEFTVNLLLTVFNDVGKMHKKVTNDMCIVQIALFRKLLYNINVKLLHNFRRDFYVRFYGS